ncbi:MAG: PspC domain-containing protein, partial [Actinomycetales bacterium]
MSKRRATPSQTPASIRSSELRRTSEKARKPRRGPGAWGLAPGSGAWSVGGGCVVMAPSSAGEGVRHHRARPWFDPGSRSRGTSGAHGCDTWWRRFARTCDDAEVSQTALGARTPPGPSSDRPPVRRAYRPADHRVVGGVAMGLAEHLDVPVLWVRVGFVVTTWFNGVGVLAYLLLWRFMPLRRPELSPGLESASRRGMRAAGRPGVLEIVQTVAVLAVGVGVLFLVQGGGRLTGSLLIPLLIVVVGVAVVWRQIDDAAWQTWLTRTTGWGFVARIAV